VLGCLFITAITIRFIVTHSYVWAGIYFLLLVLLVYRFAKDYSKPEAYYGGNNYAVIIIGLWLGYKEYSTYSRDLKLDKFGVVYNKTRQRLGIPVIPADWQPSSRGQRSGSWNANDTTIGHQRKYIILDSLDRIEIETDSYKLKPLNKVERDVSIFFRYARGKAKDSIFYSYEIGNKSITFSRSQADSLFDAEKIRKDY